MTRGRGCRHHRGRRDGRVASTVDMGNGLWGEGCRREQGCVEGRGAASADEAV